ncbi:GTPase activating protein (BUD2/CLA2) [Metarhizium album ARSEF 1941]|uniref:GTPase activating protein (BUD2/CLA2) n=1 Tax=Metarhizium album (strain ARSEF 1941) TaxID=1081103 RepID=A0A0B2WSR2_METAS|nr:GTPase activating protein (BUD2/CLA2) [Metarhizium album ARSEF 1941]KHN96527.1 GTPase activating protein (BUD2/CLA2) [Metarhizium album ARSEF 1941]
MERQKPPSTENGSDSGDNQPSRIRDTLQSAKQPTVPPPSPPVEAAPDVVDSPPSAAVIVASSSLRAAFRPETSGSMRSATPDSRPDGRRLGASAFDSSASTMHRDTQHGSPVTAPRGASRRQGMVLLNDNVDDNSYDVAEPTASPVPSQAGAQQGPQLQQQQRHPGASIRPRTRTLDAAMLMSQRTPTTTDQRHRVGSVSSSGSQHFLDDQRSLGPAIEAISHSSTNVFRLQEPSTPQTPSKHKDKKSGKRLLKRQASRPSSPVPTPSPSVDSFPLPLDASEPTKLIMLMKTLGGRMRGEIKYQMEDEGSVWQDGTAYIDDEKGCLMFNSGQAGPFFTALIPDLRGCIVLPTSHPDDKKDCLELLATDHTTELYLRPVAPEEWNLWLAALLCWQQTRALASTRPQNGPGNNSRVGIIGPAINKTGTVVEGPKSATIIKVGTILLWDKGSTGSANDLVQRSSTRDVLSPGAAWRKISSILQDDGELKLLLENDNSPLCVIQLSQLSRCAIQQLDHTVLDEEFCLAVFPIYASTATKLSIFRPVYLALDNRVQFEVWFVLLRAFAMPELYKLDADDQDSIREVADLEERTSEETFRIEKTVGVRVTEAKVKARPTGLEAHVYEKPFKAGQDPLVGNYVAEVILDGEVRARTTTKPATKNPYWREDCEFVDLPHTVQEVSIVLKRTDGTSDVASTGPGPVRAGASQEVLYGTVHVALDKPQRGKDHEDWLQIMDDKQQPIGSMLIKISHAEQIALLAVEYEPLSEILHRFPSGLTTMISTSLPGQLRRLSENFLNIFQASGHAAEWLMALVEDEIDGIGNAASIKKFRYSNRLKSNESIESASERELIVRDMSKSLAGEANLLFRGNSLLTQSLEFHMRRLGMEYLEQVLQDKIAEINELNPDCEVDTSRLPHCSGTEIDQRWSRLIQYTTEVWLCIAESARNLPSELRHILKYIRAVAEDRYGDFLRTVAYTAVSGFLFLRFICPAILSPKLFGLLRDHPQPQAQRTLTLIAKVLQKMSNMSTFGKREEWMEPMNRFLTSQRPVFRDYIDQVCGIPAERVGVKSVPAAYSTPITILGRLSPTAKEGFPSLPYLIDHARCFASLVRIWVDSRPEDVKRGQADGELLIFNELCTGLQKRADACLAQVERTRAANAARCGVAEQLAETLEQATLIESLSVPYSLPHTSGDDRPPGSSGSDGGGDESISRRKSKEWRRDRDGLDSRKASGLRQVSGMGGSSKGGKNGKMGRTILNGIMRIGGRAESPDAKGSR